MPFCIYPAVVYEYRVAEKGQKVGPRTKVNHAYYPIISEQHPFLAQLGALIQRHGSVDKIPEKEWPDITSFAVLVKTERFKSVGAIPNEWQEKKTIRGLVINRIEELDNEERNLIRSNFPHIDLDRILILEEGRRPTAPSTSMAIMGGGALLFLVGLVSLFKRKPPEQEPAEGEPHEDEQPYEDEREEGTEPRDR